MIQDRNRRFRFMIFSTAATLLGTGVFVYLCWALRPLILPIVLGVLLGFLFRPLKTSFKHHLVPESVRISLLFGVLLIALFGAIKFVQANIPNEKENLEIQVRLKYKFNQKYNQMMGLDVGDHKGNSLYNLLSEDVTPMVRTLNKFLDLSDEQKASFITYVHGVEGFEPVPKAYYQYFLENEKKTHEEVLSHAAKKETVEATPTAEKHSWLMELMDLISIWLVLPFVFVFFILDEDAMAQFFISMVPNRFFELTLTLKEKVDEAIGEYLRGICIECGLVGVFLSLGLYLIGIPANMSLLIGVLSGFATAVPFFGPIVGVGAGLVYVLIAEHLSPIIPFVTEGNAPVAVIVVNLIVLALDNMVFQPIVLGGAVELHPLVIVIGLTAGSMLFGLAGVLLAIPAIVVCKVVISYTVRGLRDYRII